LTFTPYQKQPWVRLLSYILPILPSFDLLFSARDYCPVFAYLPVKLETMKKIFVVILSMILVIGASAQHRGGGHYYRPHTRVVVGVGGYGYYPYSPFYPNDYGYWNRPYYRPSGLQLKIEDIKADYQDRIWSARHDDKLSRSERKQEIHRLKSERDHAIRDAERNYHRSY
jgi:hypothetical protein